MTLTEIGIANHTDKADKHKYLGLYELLFRHWRNAPIRLLEIGTQFGCSLRTWREWFPKAIIVGVDAVDNQTPVADTALIIGDAYTIAMIEHLDASPSYYSIIIEDGDHSPEHQSFVVAHYTQLLAQDGILVVEDIASPETIRSLRESLPAGFDYSAVDMTEGLSGLTELGLPDSRLFIAFRK